MLTQFGAAQAPTRARANARAPFAVAVTWLSLLATATLPDQSAAQSTPTCTGSILEVTASGNPHDAGISCENVEDFSINLEDAVKIATETDSGITLSGTGNLAIRSSGRRKAIVSTSGDRNDGIFVTMPFSPLPDPGSVSITVGDVRTTGEGSSAISASRITGNVSIASTGTISTSGDLSDGIFVTMPFNPEPGSVSISVRDISTIGERSNAILVSQISGDATITSSGTIRVSGPGSEGVYIDNTWRQDGSAKTYIRVRDVISTSAAGDLDLAAINALVAGGLSIVSTGTISTTTDYGFGIRAYRHQTNDPSVGPVEIAVNDLSTIGTEAHGIVSSVFHSENADIRIHVNGDLSTKGWGSHGIAVSGDKADVLVSIGPSGSIIVRKPTSPLPQKFTTPPETHAVYIKADGTTQISRSKIINLGTFVGSTYVEGCEISEFRNYGSMIPVGTIELVRETPCRTTEDQEAKSTRSNGLFKNYGEISPGGPGLLDTADFEADFTQFAEGSLEIDVETISSVADVVHIWGDADLRGSVVAKFNAIPFAVSDDPLRATFFRSSGTLENGISTGLVDSILVDYGLLHRQSASGDEQSLVLTADLDLTPDILNPNQTSVLGAIAAGRKPSLELRSVFLDYLREQDGEELKNSLDLFGNELFGAVVQTNLAESLNSVTPGIGCANAPINRDPESGVGKLSVCGWVAPRRSNRVSPGTQLQLESSELSGGTAAGVQLGWSRFPIALNYISQNSKSSINLGEFGRAESAVGRTATGLTFKAGNFDASYFATKGAGDHGTFRRLPKQAGDYTSTNGAFKSRESGSYRSLSYGIALGTWRITPTYRSGTTRFGGIEYSERGAGDFSLNVKTPDLRSEYSGSSLEIAKEFSFKNGATLTPSIGMSKTTITGLDVETISEFGGGVSSFKTARTTPGLSSGYEFGADFRSGSGNFNIGVGLGQYNSAGGHSRESAYLQVGYRF